jgi:hypothetical protein
MLSHKPNGVAIQIDLALIASVLVSLWTGLKPTRRIYDGCACTSRGVVRAEELARFLRDLQHPRGRQGAKSIPNSS